MTEVGTFFLGLFIYLFIMTIELFPLNHSVLSHECLGQVMTTSNNLCIALRLKRVITVSDGLTLF